MKDVEDELRELNELLKGFDKTRNEYDNIVNKKKQNDKQINNVNELLENIKNCKHNIKIYESIKECGDEIGEIKK